MTPFKLKLTQTNTIAFTSTFIGTWLLWTLLAPASRGTTGGIKGLGTSALQRESRRIQACTPRETAVQLELFKEHLGGIKDFSACGAGSWMRKYHELAPKGPKVLVDIGCNKGYYTAELFSLFAPQLAERLSPQKVHEHVMQQMPLPPFPCGVCNDCLGKYDPAPSGSEPTKYPVTVHSFEPSSTSFERLISLRDKSFPKDDRLLHWELHNKAVSDKSGIVSFSAACSSELCSIQSGGGGDSVQATSVDDFVASLPGSSSRSFMIDILKIDTEGFDPAVLQGARGLLAAKGAAVVYFEYNIWNLWKTTALKDVVAELETFDYVCYFEGRPTYTRITGCWADAFEFKGWSNVVCTTSGHFMHAVLERLSFRAHF